MTVITMSRTEIDQMGVLQDLAAGRIKVAAAATLMGLGRRQIYRLAESYKRHGAEALVSRRRGRPSNRSYPADLRYGDWNHPGALQRFWTDAGL